MTLFHSTNLYLPNQPIWLLTAPDPWYVPKINKTKNRKSFVSKSRFIGKPKGLVQDRVKAVGPEHFGVVTVDCAKRRSKWMLCDFYGKVIIEPTNVEHTSGTLRAMAQQVADTCKSIGLFDCIVAVEMTGIYHKPVQRAFRQAGFDTRIVHPYASSHYRRPLHPGDKTDDHDLEAIFHAAINGYGLATLPVSQEYLSLQAISRHRFNLVKQFTSRSSVGWRSWYRQLLDEYSCTISDSHRGTDRRLVKHCCRTFGIISNAHATVATT